MKHQHFFQFFVALFTVAFFGYLIYLISHFPLTDDEGTKIVTLADWGQLGDSFGVFTSLLTLLAAWGLYLQIRNEREQHKEAMELQRMFATGTNQPIVRLLDKVKLVFLRDTDEIVRQHLYEGLDHDISENAVNNTKLVVTMGFFRDRGILLNGIVRIKLTDMTTGTRLLDCAADVGCYPKEPLPNSVNAEEFGLLISNIGVEKFDAFEHAICSVSLYYQNTLGGCFVVQRSSNLCEPLLKSTYPEMTYCFDGHRITMQQLPMGEYRTIMNDCVALLQPCCTISTNVHSPFCLSCK